jgi:hypothetical protein
MEESCINIDISLCWGTMVVFMVVRVSTASSFLRWSSFSIGMRCMIVLMVVSVSLLSVSTACYLLLIRNLCFLLIIFSTFVMMIVSLMISMVVASSKMVMSLALMQDFHLNEVEEKSHNGSDHHLFSLYLLRFQNPANGFEQ